MSIQCTFCGKTPPFLKNLQLVKQNKIKNLDSIGHFTGKGQKSIKMQENLDIF